ncbi:MAG: ribonuclease Z [Rhodothermales bacterium]|nr:ribonuclease Z [Rhodothermales bacterium]
MEEYIVPLGVSAAIPFGGRHLSSVALKISGDLMLLDCGEATQFQLRAAGVKPGPLRTIFITHLHGDHYYGLLGLLATLSLVGRTTPLTIVGPADLEAFLRSVPTYEGRKRSFDIRFIPLASDFSSGVVYHGDTYTVRAARLDHTVFAVGYRVDVADTPGTLDVDLARSLGVVDPVQYGRLKMGEAVVGMLGRVESSDVLGPPHRGASFAYVTDTRPCAGGQALAKNVDLLYHEATFLESEQHRAVETGHSTAKGAAEVAESSGARRLMLAHFSARYPDCSVLEAEARSVFPNSMAAVELKRYKLKEESAAGQPSES